MLNKSKIPAKLVRKMNEVYFDLSSDGVLVYMDPLIGALSNPSRELVVKLNLETLTFEFLVGDIVEQAFKLVSDIEETCRDAFGAYFTKFEEMCRQPVPESLAA